jgi:hypothetical protein
MHMPSTIRTTFGPGHADRPSLEHTADALGRGVALGDLAELRALQADWTYDDWMVWFAYLDTPSALAWQWRGYAWAPGGLMWQAAAGFRERLDAEARHHRASVDRRRQQTAGTAFRLLRMNTPSRTLLSTLLDENRRRPMPLPDKAVINTALWAARQHVERGNA